MRYEKIWCRISFGRERIGLFGGGGMYSVSDREVMVMDGEEFEVFEC